MRLFLTCLFAVGLAGCSSTAVVVAGAAAWVGSEYVYDTPPLGFVAEVFGQSCDKYSVYDQPPEGRR